MAEDLWLDSVYGSEVVGICDSAQLPLFDGTNGDMPGPRGPRLDMSVASTRISSPLSTLTSFDSMVSLSPLFGPSSPPMPIPDTFEDVTLASTPATSVFPPATPMDQLTLPAPLTLPPPPTPPTQPTPATPPTPTPATKSKPRAAANRMSHCRAAKSKLSTVDEDHNTTKKNGNNRNRTRAQAQARRPPLTTLKREVEQLRSKVGALRAQKWALENEVTQLQAQLLTGRDEVRAAQHVEAQLVRARRLAAALRRQVRALGGYVLSSGGESEEEMGAVGGDGHNSGDDDGELPACFPQGAAHPEEYTLSAMRYRRMLRRKQKRCA